MMHGDDKHAPKESENILLNLPEEMRDILPENFSFDDFGKIDLKEAEYIANEKIFFITEKELIEELEEFDLVPLKDGHVRERPHEEGETFPREDEIDRLLKAVSIGDEIEVVRGPTDGFLGTEPGHRKKTSEERPPDRVEEIVESRKEVPVKAEKESSATSPAHAEKKPDERTVDSPTEKLDLNDSDKGPDGQKWVALESVVSHEKKQDKVSGDKQKWISLEDIHIEKKPLRTEQQPTGESLPGPVDEDVPAKTGDGITSSPVPGYDMPLTEESTAGSDDAEARPPEADADVLPASLRTLTGDDSTETEKDYKETEEVVIPPEPEEFQPVSAADIPETKPVSAGPEDTMSDSAAEKEEEDENVLWLNFDDPRKIRKPTGGAGAADSPAVKAVADREQARVPDRERHPVIKPAMTRVPAATGGKMDDGFSIVKEVLPDEFLKMGRDDGTVVFIDDTVVEKDIIDSKKIFEENELDRVTSEMVVMDEGKGYLLAESSSPDERSAIIQSASLFVREQDDVIFEFEEHRYHDDELDFIHSAIIEEDYVKYIRQIDEFSDGTSADTVTTAVEILGITKDEVDEFHAILFGDEYADKNLYDIFDFFSLETGKQEKTGRSDRICKYLSPDEKGITADEKRSIEEDLYAMSAFIYEEDVDEIRRLLALKGRPAVDVKTDRTETAKEAPSAAEKPAEGPKAPAEPVRETNAAAVEELNGSPSKPESIDNITDSVLILEDEMDVDRFVKDFPEAKQKDIKTLLKYLDGLFERLPENIIRRFASSEYFDLYLKILNELGV